MKLPMSKSHNSILVVYDRFSKISYFVVTTERMIAEELARLFRDYMWKLHRLCQARFTPGWKSTECTRR